MVCSGPCPDPEVCNAQLPILDFKVLNMEVLNDQDATAGICVNWKAAGSDCVPGSGKMLSLLPIIICDFKMYQCLYHVV